MNMTRLLEKLRGYPHQQKNAEKVAAASEELSEAARSLTSHLKPYANAEDPFLALMIDVFNKRQMLKDEEHERGDR